MSGTTAQPGVTAPAPVARTVAALLEAIFAGPPPLRIEFWDGSSVGPADSEHAVLVRSPDALRRIVWAPGELGVARAYVCGDLDIVGPVEPVLARLERVVRGNGLGHDPRRLAQIVRPALDALRQLDLVGTPPPPPPEEHVASGRRHSITRDRQVVSHHYDVGNDFYALVLGPSMTYSCARFANADTSLEDAQGAKHELICRKLGLADQPPGAAPRRLLDVGCGWGSMAIHAAVYHGCRVVGVTVSQEQAEAARARVTAAGVGDHVDIRLQDYRLVDDGPYDAISSVGMAEHVGAKRMDEYFAVLHSLLAPRGRLLNHAISSPGGSRIGGRSFIGRYVFPDGELLDIAETVLSMEVAGFEVRDVESLREHYATTLRHWVANLERHWDEAVALVGERRARVWRLYMSASITRFTDARIAVHQVLGVVPDSTGTSGMPPTRAAWEPSPTAGAGPG